MEYLANFSIERYFPMIISIINKSQISTYKKTVLGNIVLSGILAKKNKKSSHFFKGMLCFFLIVQATFETFAILKKNPNFKHLLHLQHLQEAALLIHRQSSYFMFCDNKVNKDRHIQPVPLSPTMTLEQRLSQFLVSLKDKTKRYSPQRLFFALLAKKELIMLFGPFLVSSKNIGNFQQYPQEL